MKHLRGRSLFTLRRIDAKHENARSPDWKPPSQNY